MPAENITVRPQQLIDHSTNQLTNWSIDRIYITQVENSSADLQLCNSVSQTEKVLMLKAPKSDVFSLGCLTLQSPHAEKFFHKYLIFTEIHDTSLTCAKFPDISRFSRQDLVVTLTGYISM